MVRAGGAKPGLTAGSLITRDVEAGVGFRSESGYPAGVGFPAGPFAGSGGPSRDGEGGGRAAHSAGAERRERKRDTAPRQAWTRQRRSVNP